MMIQIGEDDQQEISFNAREKVETDRDSETSRQAGPLPDSGDLETT
jgi:hypothetical protein